MLTSFFGKSKPVNGVAITIFLIIFFIIANFKEWFLDFNLLVFLEKLAVLLSLIVSVFTLNFIAKKNELTQRSAYKILFFAIFTASFFALLKNHQVIFANLLVLLALRRIISLKSKKVMQKKVFDATFWICIASLFYFWSILFLVVVYAGILYYLPKPKNWLIPPIAALAVAVLTLSFHIIAYDQFYTFSQWFEWSNFDYSNYQNLEILIPVSIILTLTLWTLVQFFAVVNKASVSMKPSLNLVLLSLLTAVAVAIFAPTKDGSELIFFFVPLSIITSIYFDQREDKVFREVLLVLLILMPLCIPFIF
ncbi:hypothetical protein APR41_00905 [Salegentibacter salinarum]|uniref:Beta-carotene 15,15'-monooxygenase n=1 Tax=Salegentibacter salinarum TaxID=447422 RepID=A0A2N0U3X3_9FLAO|nr:DUF6427 family protein [Salegentibacter salinarum]PKD21578.1 hypothetical protein APR41_00905 [Salegentibacter salinarum]SKB36480.1 hypothetical protein SAMN05660903_00386 [Salegentibacter salinarum]